MENNQILPNIGIFLILIFGIYIGLHIGMFLMWILGGLVGKYMNQFGAWMDNKLGIEPKDREDFGSIKRIKKDYQKYKEDPKNNVNPITVIFITLTMIGIVYIVFFLR